jgi:uncharacterized membrane protein
MAMTESTAAERCFVLRPDNGLYWRTTLRVYLFLAAVCLTVAIGFTMAGFWPVLPFAGLELALLGAALYVTARRGRYREVVRISGQFVSIEKGYVGPSQHWQFERVWTEVLLQPSRRRLHPARLLIRSGAVYVELGSFLTEEDRASLARQLEAAIGPMASGGSVASRA